MMSRLRMKRLGHLLEEFVEAEVMRDAAVGVGGASAGDAGSSWLQERTAFEAGEGEEERVRREEALDWAEVDLGVVGARGGRLKD